MKKNNIKINVQPLQQEDFAKHQNFGQFMHYYNKQSMWYGKFGKLYLTLATSLLITSGILLYHFVSQSKIPKLAKQNKMPFIAPPIMKLDPSKSVYDIDNSKDTLIYHTSGTTIFIPKNTFVYFNGNKVNGRIKITFREFRDQVDLVFSGIPMTYDSAGIGHQFESAGMFEILAHKNDSALKLLPGKELLVDMKTCTDENDFNVYYLDTIRKNWNYETGNTRKNKDQIQELVREAKGIEMQYNLVHPTNLLMPEKADRNLKNFQIDYRKDEFPELSAFDGICFEPTSNSKTDMLQHSIVWEDVQIQRMEKQNRYLVLFKTDNETIKVEVRPVVNEKDYEKAMLVFNEKRALYKKLYDQKVNRLMQKKREKRLNSTFNTAYSADKRLQEYMVNRVVYRTVAVDELGVWNCDRYTKENNLDQTRYAINFLSARDGRLLNISTAYLINRSKNTIYPFPKESFNRFSSLSKTDFIIAISSENEVFYVKDKNLKELNLTQTVLNINMEKLSSAEKTTEELKKIMGI